MVPLEADERFMARWHVEEENGARSAAQPGCVTHTAERRVWSRETAVERRKKETADRVARY